MAATSPTFLLVHGSWHGAWCWAALRAELDQAALACVAIDLPSAIRGETPEPLPGVAQDAEAVVRALAVVDGPVVVVGHSYGGVPVTEAAARAGDVVHVVYLAAYVPDVGDTVFGMYGAPAPDAAIGTLPPPPNAQRVLYNGVAPERAARAVAALVPQSVRSWADPVGTASWRSIPSTYVVCDEDNALTPARQREFASHSAVVCQLASGHSPFLSMPAQLGPLLTSIGTRAAGRRS